MLHGIGDGLANDDQMSLQQPWATGHSTKACSMARVIIQILMILINDILTTRFLLLKLISFTDIVVPRRGSTSWHAGSHGSRLTWPTYANPRRYAVHAHHSSQVGSLLHLWTPFISGPLANRLCSLQYKLDAILLVAVLRKSYN